MRTTTYIGVTYRCELKVLQMTCLKSLAKTYRHPYLVTTRTSSHSVDIAATGLSNLGIIDVLKRDLFHEPALAYALIFPAASEEWE